MGTMLGEDIRQNLKSSNLQGSVAFCEKMDE